MKRDILLLSLGVLGMMATSCSKETSSNADSDYVSVQLEDSKMWSLLDVGTGKIVMTDEFFAPSTRVVNGSFFVENDNNEFDLYNLKDTKNKLNRNSYTIVSNFNDAGYAIARVKDEPWQIVNTEGTVVATIDKEINVLSNFSNDGLAIIANKDNMQGYVNTEGQMVIKPRYKFASYFSDGVAFVLTKEEDNHNYFAAIDPAGNTLFSFSDAKYSDVSYFHEGHAFAVEGDHCILLDKTGKKLMTVCNGTALTRLSYHDGKMIYYDGEFFGVKNTEDKILIRAKYQRLKFQSDGNLIAKNSNGKWGVVDSGDEIVMPFDYDRLDYLAPGKYITQSGNVFVLIDTKGKEICDHAFSSFMNRSDSANELDMGVLITSGNNQATNNQEPEEEEMNAEILNLFDYNSDFGSQENYGGANNFTDGLNTLRGQFNFEGANYPFTITLNYVSATNSVLSAQYIADGTGSTNDITSFEIAPDGSSLDIKGPGLQIWAVANPGVPGQYTGSMTRGTHSGTITMNL